MPHDDFILPISFKTAKAIGLEESVLLAFLQQHAHLQFSRSLSFDINTLAVQLPFWTSPILLRILSSLQLCQLVSFERKGDRISIHLQTQGIAPSNPLTKEDGKSDFEDQDLLEKVSRLQQQAKTEKYSQVIDRPNARSSALYDKPVANKVKSSHTDKFSAPSWPIAAENNKENRRGVTDFDLYLEQKERTRQPDQWQPEEATLEQIVQAGIHRQFALQLQAEFLLRIKEQRKNVRTWNSEFFKYVKRQWQYSQSDRSSNEGTQSSSYNPRTSKEQVSDALTNIHDTDW